MRLFLAIGLPTGIRKELASVRRRIGDEHARIKWVEPENAHLTLKFLGEVPEEKLVKIREALAAVKAERFSCSLRGIGAFPSMSYIRVIWAGMEPAGKLTGLQRKVDDALAGLGFAEEGDFHPHVTLGRVKSVRDKEKLSRAIDGLEAIDFGNPFEVKGFALKKSTLTPKGPVYEDLETFGLM